MTTDDSPERVLVFGDDMRIFLSVARSLGRAGKEVHAVPFDHSSPALRSKYVHYIHALPDFCDSPIAWRDAVLALLRSTEFKLVIPTCDRVILAFDAFRENFDGFPIALHNEAVMGSLFDKRRTRELAIKLGIPVSRGRALQRVDTAEQLVAELGLPMALKPSRSYSLTRQSFDSRGQVAIVRTEAELVTQLRVIADHSGYIVERYFRGDGVGVSVLANQGHVVQAFQHRRLREGRSGSSCRISEPVNPALLQACEATCRHTGMTGICMFEFRYDRDARDWVLLEANARFWGSLPLPLSLGVDFPRFLYDLMVSKSNPAQIAYPAGIIARNFALDGRNLLADIPRLRELGLRSWLAGVLDFLTQPLRWVTGSERSDTFVKDDLAPAFLECLRLLGIPRWPASRKGSKKEVFTMPASDHPQS